MNTVRKTFKLKKILVSAIMAFAMITSSFVGYSFNARPTFVAASFKQEVSLISNNNFSNTSSSVSPPSPSNWVLNTPSGAEKIKAGVINVYPEVFTENKSDYELSTNPGTIENGKTYEKENSFYKNLMLNSYEGYKNAYYETSNAFTLAASSYYAINVVLKTQDNALASIYLSGLTDADANAHIENINTRGEWEQYTLLVSTNSFNAESAVKLQLWLGSNPEFSQGSSTTKGAVFFNNVNVIRYSASTFALEKHYANELGNTKYILVELNDPENNAPVTNANFEQDGGDTNIITGFKTLHNYVGDNNEQTLKIISVTNDAPKPDDDVLNPRSNNAPDNTRALYMRNRTSGYQGIESGDITINRSIFYAISVWAKSDSGVGNGGTIKLVEKNPNASDPFNEEEFTPVEASLSASTTAGENQTTNGWQKYTFYVEGHPHENKVVNLQLWLGTSASQTTGYVFYDNITLKQIRYANYSSGSSASNSKIYTFNTDNNQFTIANGNFNLTDNEQSTTEYPLTPRNWTHSANDDALSGVINTKQDVFNSFLNSLNTHENPNFHGTFMSNPGLAPNQQSHVNTVENTSNNILLLGNPVGGTQTYTSQTFTLSADNYYKITFALQTQFAHINTTTSGVNVKVSSSDQTVIAIENISTDAVWKTYTFYIAPSKEYSATLAVTLNNITGYAFIDDVELTSVTEDEFGAAFSNNINGVYIANYKTENFSNYTQSDKALNTPYVWSGQSNVSTQDDLTRFGILNTNKIYNNDNFIGMPNPMPQKGENVLFINSIEDTYYSASTTGNYTLESGNYYKIVVRIKTYAISQESSNTKFDENDKAYAAGASLKLRGFDEQFTGINTETLSENNLNDWVEFVFYVSPTSTTTTSVEISLGSANALTSGYVFVDSIELSTMEKDIYTEAVTSIGKSKTELSLTELAANTNSDTDESGDSFKGADFNWLIVSSLLFSISIIIALVGTALRRINFKPRKRIKTSYDRRKTVELEMNKRERIEFRKNIISDLRLEFESIDKEIEEFLQENNARLEEIRQRAEERRNRYNEISVAILTQIENVKENYARLESQETNAAAIAKLQNKRNAEIAKLETKQKRAKENSIRREKHFEQLQEKRAQYLERQKYRKQLIEEEIARIEREIEEIAREEEKIWSDYRKAKEEAKKAKMEYYAKKRAEKREKKQDNSTNNEN